MPIFKGEHGAPKEPKIKDKITLIQIIWNKIWWTNLKTNKYNFIKRTNNTNLGKINKIKVTKLGAPS